MSIQKCVCTETTHICELFHLPVAMVILTLQLYDATGGQMKQLAIHPCEKDITHWQGGDFISMDTIAVWSKVVTASDNLLLC